MRFTMLISLLSSFAFADTAIQCNSYGEAKFAFCQAQGFGYLVDFQGFDLSKSGTGSGRLGSKTCNAGEPIQWSPKSYPFELIYNIDGSIRINFPTTRIETYISTSKSRNGLAHESKYSVMHGNSGTCFFVQTEAHSDLPLTYECS